MGSPRALTVSSVVVVSSEQVSSLVGEEEIVLGLGTGSYYGLADVGRRIWELLHEPRPVSEIHDLLLRDYQVDAARCEKDLLELLTRLQEEKLIEVRHDADP